MDRETFCLIYDLALIALIAFAVYITRSFWPVVLMVFVAYPSEEGKGIINISVGDSDEDSEEDSKEDS